MKTGPMELAAFGGKPAFQRKLHVGEPNIGDRSHLISRIDAILERRWLTNNGPCVQELEERICELLGVRHFVAVCNGTVALEIAIRALGLSGEVIVPAMTFIATAHALEWLRITPVFCDVDRDTHNLDPERVEQLITPRTSAVMGVHLWGRACDVERLDRIAHQHGIKLLFDAAHAFHCSHGGQMIGSFGNAEVFSFHATKFFNTLEGGGVATNDDELAGRLRRMRNFGFSAYDTVVDVGTNGKMNEISAAMGLTLMEELPAIVAVNKRNYLLYKACIGSTPGIRMVEYDENETCNYQYIVLEIDQERAGLSRDQLVDILWAENVLARRYFFPGCHRMEPYASANSGLRLTETETLVERTLSLPTGTAVSESDIETICGILNVAVHHADSVRERMNGMGPGMRAGHAAE